MAEKWYAFKSVIDDLPDPDIIPGGLRTMYCRFLSEAERSDFIQNLPLSYKVISTEIFEREIAE
jgi:hypothetical protein